MKKRKRTQRAKLCSTKDYSRFVHSKENRPVVKNCRHIKDLMAKMREVGFLVSEPISVWKRPDRKLEVLNGQHRLEAAKKLGIEVWYVVEEERYSPAELPVRRWQNVGFVKHYVRKGKEAYRRLQAFYRRHKIPVGYAGDLLTRALSVGTTSATIRDGSFQITEDGERYANRVVSTWRRAYENYPCLKNKAFLGALMMVFRLDNFEPVRLIKKIETCAERIQPFSTRERFLEMIDDIYNYRVPLEKQQPIGLEARKVQARHSKRCRAAPVLVD